MTREDPAAFAPPPAFGPFRVLHQIGVGALGPVFRTYEPTRDRLIAVKVFRLDVTPEQAHTLADELSRAADAGLFHPSIVEPVAAGLEGAVAYRAEEYVAAESLDAAIRHHAPAPLEKTLPFITQLAGAVDFARAAGIGHGALHLRDVFVTPDEVRISGFGVVEALERTGLRAPVRRPYSAPERIAGGEWSTAADVFSLAAICYELLTGRRPAGTGLDIGELEAGGFGGVEGGAHARMVHDVLARAMDEDPAARFQSALAFASALEAAARGDRVSGAVGQVGAIAAATAPAAMDTRGRDADPLDGASGAEADADADDIAVERDEDAVYYDLAEEERELQDAQEPEAAGRESSFDDVEVEAEEDLAFAPPPARFTDEFEGSDEEASTAGGVQSADERPHDRAAVAHSQARMPYDAPYERYHTREREEDAYEPADAAPAYLPAVEPARSDMLPRAVFLVLGLLIGFAAGFAARGGVVPPEPAQAEAVVDEPQSDPAPPAVAGSDTEQPLQPPVVAPDIPDEVPPVSASRPEAPAAGRLVVNSTPAKAAVTINGEWRGRTPLTLDEQPFGTYNIRVVQEGYTVATEEVVLSAANPSRTVAVRLERPAPPRPAPAPPRATPPASQRPAVYTGSMYIDSRPRGARVLLNGKVVGETPLRLPDLPIGSHVVRLELDGHRVWSTSARVQAGQERRVTGSLDPIR